MTCDEIRAALKVAQSTLLNAQLSLSSTQQQAFLLEYQIAQLDPYAPTQWTIAQCQNRIDWLKGEPNSNPSLPGMYGQLIQLLTQIPILQANVSGAQSMVIQYQTQMAQQGCQ